MFSIIVNMKTLLLPICSYTHFPLFLVGTSDPSKVTSKTSLSSATSASKTNSTRSTFTLPSIRDRSEPPRTEGEILSSSNLKAFLFNDLKNATKNFRPDSLLGEGGFGHVFKGWIDEHTLAPSKPGSGMVVAVKKLKPEGFQGHKEWLVGSRLLTTNFLLPSGYFSCLLMVHFPAQTEVNYLGQLHHANLVKLIGYCSDGDNRLLVYEFMPKGSLENHLFRSMFFNLYEFYC